MRQIMEESLTSCPCGIPNCRVGPYLRKLTIERALLERPRTLDVKTWCRVCGQPVLLERIALDYEYAIRHFSALDDQPMVHRQSHAEVGGWGVHWRLDDVLRLLFPHDHDYEAWPKPLNYPHGAAEEMPVEVIGEEGGRYKELALRELEEALSANACSREDLEQEYSDVLDENEFSMAFENLGYRPPFVLVRCLETGAQGSIMFQNYPRLYFGFDRNRVV